jgi:polysaccharide biosynthesis/export protein
MKSFVCAMLFAMVVLAAPVTVLAQQPAASTPAPVPPSAPPLTIGSGDLVDVAMFDAPDLSGRFRVDEKGNIQLPLIGTIHAQGLTADQAAKLIQQQYVTAEILKPDSAQASFFIEEYANQGITITGEVRAPGVYPALGVRMLNDVVTAAGGVTVMASSKVLITHRDDPEHPVTVEYNPTALAPMIPPVQILPGDSIVIPRAGLVYVVGNVNKPGAYVLDGRNTLTVEQVMGLAGGAGHAAKLKKAALVRILPDGRKEMIVLAVNQIFAGTSPDVALKDQDILYVPTDTRKLVLEQAIQSALSIGTQFAIYRSAYSTQ